MWHLLAPWHSAVYHSSSCASFPRLVHPVAVITSKPILINSSVHFKLKWVQCLAASQRYTRNVVPLAPTPLTEHVGMVGKNILLASWHGVSSLQPIAYEFRNPGHWNSCLSLKYLTACDFKIWKSRNPFDSIPPGAWAGASSAWRNISFLNYDFWLSLRASSFPLSDLSSPRVGLCKLHTSLGLKEDLCCFVFPLFSTYMPFWPGWLLLESTGSTLGGKFTGLCEKFSLRSTFRHLRRSQGLFLNTL